MIDLGHLTAQEVADRVVEGLASQDFKRSLQEDGNTCAYRGVGGLKCAAGWLIPDEEYRPEFDGDVKVWRDIVANGWATATHADVIARLQNAHDAAENSSEVKTRLRWALEDLELEIHPLLKEV